MSSKTRIGVLGAGWWATEHHIPNLKRREEVELAAVCRLGAAELELVRDRFGFAHASEDFRELLDRVPMDGVVVASPHVAHYENAKAALEHGCHVLVEKPMTTTTAEARDLVETAARVGRQIMMPHGYNFTHYMPAAARFVASGQIGQVRHVNMHMSSALLDLFGGQPMEGTADHTFRPAASTWAYPERAGGYGWGQLSHLLGALFRIADLRAEEVFAYTGLSPTGADYFDAASIRFTDGAIGVMSGSAAVAKQGGAELDIRLYGTEGALLLDLGRERLEVRRFDGRVVEHPMVPGEGVSAYSTRAPIDAFVDLCLGRDVANEASGEVGLRAVEVLDAMYRSAASGRPERV